MLAQIALVDIKRQLTKKYFNFILLKLFPIACDKGLFNEKVTKAYKTGELSAERFKLFGSNERLLTNEGRAVGVREKDHKI